MYSRALFSVTVIIAASIFLILPSLVFAQSESFIPLIPFPKIDYNDVDMVAYFNVIYRLVIAAAAIFAVGKLMVAGFKYLTSELISDKGDAKKDIRGAIVGLLIILSTIVILQEINPNLIKPPTLSDIPPIPSQPQVNVINPSVPIDDPGVTCSQGRILIMDKNRNISCITQEQRDDQFILTTTNTDFSGSPIDNQTFNDVRERSPDLKDYTIGDIIGYLFFDDTKSTDLNIVYNFDRVAIEEMLRSNCGNDNTLVTVGNSGSINPGTAYYCMRGN